jgi:hypothetical protein
MFRWLQLPVAAGAHVDVASEDTTRNRQPWRYILGQLLEGEETVHSFDRACPPMHPLDSGRAAAPNYSAGSGPCLGGLKERLEMQVDEAGIVSVVLYLIKCLGLQRVFLPCSHLGRRFGAAAGHPKYEPCEDTCWTSQGRGGTEGETKTHWIVTIE